jgi:hypothetical protein
MKSTFSNVGSDGVLVAYVVRAHGGSGAWITTAEVPQASPSEAENLFGFNTRQIVAVTCESRDMGNSVR